MCFFMRNDRIPGTTDASYLIVCDSVPVYLCLQKVNVKIYEF